MAVTISWKSLTPLVLVPIDFRFFPKEALRTAASLANDHGASVTLLYVADTSWEIYREEIERCFCNAAAIVSEYGPKPSAEIVRGWPVHAVINAVASDLGADVIVMATHGRRGLAHALLRSVTEDVLRNADVPVLVVHESHRMSPAPYVR